MNRRQRIAKAPQNRKLWQKLYYKHQKSYQRKKLEAIKLLWDGSKLVDVCFRLECAKDTLNNWIDTYLSGGFDALLLPKKSGKTGKGQLTANKLKILKYIILHKLPSDYPTYNLSGHVWTLCNIKILLVEKWNITLEKSWIHEILHKKLNLSFQKFHRDYANADKNKQKEFAVDLQNRIDNKTDDEVYFWYDEFSVSTRPQASYGWAEKNTTPTIPSDEKKENVIMDF